MIELTPCTSAADVRARVDRLRGAAWKQPERAVIAPPPPAALPPPPKPKPAVVFRSLVSAQEPPAPAPAQKLPPPALPEEPPPPVCATVARVVAETARYFRTTVIDLLSERRDWPKPYQRQIAMYVATKVTLRSLPAIGLHMGARDHTTVLHGKRQIQKLLDAGNAKTQIAVEEITARLAAPIGQDIEPGPPPMPDRAAWRMQWPNREWSTDDIAELDRLQAEGLTPREISPRLQRSTRSIHSKRRALALMRSRTI